MTMAPAYIGKDDFLRIRRDERKMQRPLVLAILDGWGYRAEREANAIAKAHKPNYD